MMMVFFIFGLIICIMAGCKSGLDEYNKDKNIRAINDIKERLNSVGIVFNHSLRLINKVSEKVAYFRLYKIEYNPETKTYYGKGYVLTSRYEIGEWNDDVNVLFTIAENNDIEDCDELSTVNINGNVN